jgi:hypothetical protein
MFSIKLVAVGKVIRGVTGVKFVVKNLKIIKVSQGLGGSPP